MEKLGPSDDFWFEKSTSHFNFDDNLSSSSSEKRLGSDNDKFNVLKSDGLDEAAETILSGSLSSLKIQKPSTPDSQQDLQSQSRNLKIKVAETLKKIILNQEYSLLQYKGKDEKLELLKSAVQSHDGNAILTVVLFLKSTLKRSIFQYEISKCPEAINMYLSYLEEDHETDELINMLLFLGRNEDAAMIQYKAGVSIQQPERKIKWFENCLNTHFQPEMVDKFYIDSVREHLSLVREQVALEDHRRAESENEADTFLVFEQLTSRKRLLDSPAMLSLMFCEIYFHDANKMASVHPANSASRYNLSKKQCTWGSLRALAFTQRWKEIDELFLTKKWLGGEKMKSCIGFANVVEVLTNMNAPIEIVSKYVGFVEDPDSKLNLAKKFQCHSLVIEIMKSNRDRKGLMEYMSVIPQHTVAFIAATDILSSSAIKWKN